jgi:hypothetical protein
MLFGALFITDQKSLAGSSSNAQAASYGVGGAFMPHAEAIFGGQLAGATNPVSA